MYLRRNTVQIGCARHVYLSLAHNAWVPASLGRRGESRPVVLLRFGREDAVSVAAVRETIGVIESALGVREVATREGVSGLQQLRKRLQPLEPAMRKLVARSADAMSHPSRLRDRIVQISRNAHTGESLNRLTFDD